MPANRISTRCSHRHPHRAQMALLLAASVLMAATACRQQAKPPAAPPETQPAVTASPALPVEPSPAAPAAQTAPAEHPRHFEVSEAGPIKTDRELSADQPLVILGKFDPQKPARLTATLESDTLMNIGTQNVQALRLDLLTLPRERGGRLVLHIDGQGIEITGKRNQVIDLRRSPVGEWSFGRP
jgi:hypothetical protein